MEETQKGVDEEINGALADGVCACVCLGVCVCVCVCILILLYES